MFNVLAKTDSLSAQSATGNQMEKNLLLHYDLKSKIICVSNPKKKIHKCSNADNVIII